MMEKANHYQLELFTQTGRCRFSQPKEEGRNRFLSELWRYEKALLIIIGFIITAVSSYSLGVEKGKRNAMLKNNSNLDIAVKKQVSGPSSHTKEIVIQDLPEITNTAQPSTPKKIQLQIPIQTQNYTIQLATYQASTYAQKEAEKLKKRGLLPLVLPKGEYQVLCVGNFSNRNAAASLLSELKKQYRDCFIRRL